MEKYVLSKMSDKNFAKAVCMIFLQTSYNNLQYPEYRKWFYTVNLPRIIDGGGDVIFHSDGLEIVNLAVLKNTDEKKICTLLVNEDYRKKGYGREILEDAFEYLGTEKPLITIPEKRLLEFSSFVEDYDWNNTGESDKYFSKELIFNGKK